MTTFRWALIGVVALVLHAGAAAADDDFFLLDPRICARGWDLSAETQAWCDSIVGLSGRALYKATVVENLRRTNTPPVAWHELVPTLPGMTLAPGRVDLDASGSHDDDGAIIHYLFQLFDDDTGEILAGPVETRQPFASLRFDDELPFNLRATLTVEDEDGAFDTAELTSPVEVDATCSSTKFTCSVSSGTTSCAPKSSTTSFTTDDVLAAAQICDSSITAGTKVLIDAGGGNGGFDALGGRAAMATTLANLDATFGSPASGTTYCYGLGKAGGTGNTGTNGGASSLLRTCQNVSQTETTGVLVIAGGGGGSGDLTREAGGDGGFAGSTEAGSCPPDCISSSSANGQGQGGESGGRGGGGGSNGIGGQGGGVPGVGPTGWVQGDPKVTGGAGAGGTETGCCQGGRGGGGGGYGGGGGSSQGGGGGGSFAAQSTCTLASGFFAGDGHQGDGFLVFAFDNSAVADDCSGGGGGGDVPVVQSVTPSTVTIGDPFTIAGTGFVDVQSVVVGAVALDPDNYTVNSATQITAIAPPCSPNCGAARDVQVVNEAGASFQVVRLIINQ